MAPTETSTTMSPGTGFDPTSQDPLAPQAAPERKTRFSDREKETEEKRAEEKLAHADVKALARPVKATPQESADEKTQAAPLGLNGNTGKKKKVKVKRAKDEPKERLQDKPKPVENTPVPASPTVNPALGATPPVQPAPANSQTSDHSTLPPASTPAPGAPPQGQPLPSTTSSDPNAPTTTPAPH